MLIGAEVSFDVWTGQQLYFNDSTKEASLNGWSRESLTAVKRFWELKAVDKRSILTIGEKKIELHFKYTRTTAKWSLRCEFTH
jgi:hypothetical protein